MRNRNREDRPAAIGRSKVVSFLPIGLIIAFGLLYYHELTLGGRVLVSVDALTYFYPNLGYLGQRLREGALPLWNPYIFAGAPFLANSQTGVFYPPNWLVVFLSPERSYSWLIGLHAIVAAIGSYFFSRRALRLSPMASTVTGIIFAFGGFLSSQVGHLNQLQATAWLPFLLLAVDTTMRKPRVGVALLGGLCLALQLFSGHTQVAYYSVWAVAIYAATISLATFFWFARENNLGGALRKWLGWLLPRVMLVGLLGGFGAGLASVQLLPTFELTGLSIRAGGLDIREALSFSFPPYDVLLGLLPTFGQTPIFSEYLGYIGLTGLMLAGVGALSALPGLSRETQENTLVSRKVALLAVALFGLLLAFGQFNFLYDNAVRSIPGFGLFRVPARWLLLYSFGMAGLAGFGLDALRSGALHRGRTIAGLLALILIVALPVVLYGLTQREYPLDLPGALTATIWAVLTFALLLLVWLSGRVPARNVALILALIVPIELFGASFNLDLNRGIIDEAVSAPIPETDFLQSAVASDLENGKGPGRVLGVSENTFEVGRVYLYEEMARGRLSAQGFYDYLVTLKHRKTLSPNLPVLSKLETLDGYDGGVLPLQRYVDFKSAFPVEGKNLVDGRLRLQVRTAPDSALIGLFNVRYLVMDRARDLWLDGIYHDVSQRRTIRPNESAQFSDLEHFPTGQPFLTTDVSLISQVEDIGQPSEEQARLDLLDESGEWLSLPIRPGTETDQARLGKDQPPDTWNPKPVKLDSGLTPPGEEPVYYYYRWTLPSPRRIVRAMVSYLGSDGSLTLRAMSLSGKEPGEERPIDLSPDYRIVFLGDAKIYEQINALPRAYIAPMVLVAEDVATIDALNLPPVTSGSAALVRAEDWEEGVARGDLPEDIPFTIAESGKVTMVEYRPERIVIEADLESPGLLVISDASYPGWRVSVNEQERPMLTTNYLFRGVYLEAGRHRVELTFAPTSLRNGLILSLGAVLFGIGALIFERRLGLTRSPVGV